MKSRQSGFCLLAGLAACLAQASLAQAQTGEILLRTGTEPLADCTSPGGTVTVELQLDNLAEAVNGVQAVMTYDDAVMTLNAGASSESAGWTRIILNDSAGTITYAIVNLGGSVGPTASPPDPVTVGTLVFDVIAAGSTTIDFESNSTKITPLDLDPLVITGASLTRVDSGVISSDGAIASNNGPVCSGDALTLTGATPGSAPNEPYSYEWSGPDSYSSFEQSPTVSASATIAMSGTYTLTVTNGDGCVYMATTEVVVNASPTPAISADPGVGICDGGTITLDAGDGYAGYSWSTGAMTQTINVTASGTYSVTVTDANGCTGSDDIDVTVHANPTIVISASPDTTACDGDVITLDAGAGFQSYLWSTTETTQTIDVTAGGNYSVIVTDSNGCTATDDIDVTFNPAPAPTIVATPGDSICSGGAITLDAGAGFTSYLWSPGGATTQTIDVTTGGTYSVTVTNGFDCEGSDSIDVTVHANPTIAIAASPSDTVCNGETITLDAGAGYTNYLWSPGGETSQTIDVTVGGNYSVAVTDANGCMGVDDIDVTFIANPSPAIVATPGATICAGGTITLDAGAGFTSYLWSPGGATTQTIDVTTSGNYSVLVTNAGGCEGSDSIAVTVNANPVITISATPGATACDGETITLDAGAGYAGYSWSPGGETSQTIDVTAGGNYSVVVTDANGCMGGDDIDVTFNPNPTVTITASNGLSICAGGSTTLDAGPGFASYLWTPGGETTQTIAVSTAGTYGVSVTDGNGCSGSDEVEVVVNPIPVASAGSNAMACVDETAIVVGGAPTASGGAAPYAISWSGSGSTFLSALDVENPTFDASAAGVGTYTLCVDVTDDNGCVAAQSCMTLTVETCIDIALTVEGLSGNPILPGGPYGAPGGASLTRDVEFVLTDCVTPALTQTRVVPVTFTPSGVNGSAIVRLSGVPAAMSSFSAREGHTLRSLATVDVSSGLALAPMTLRSGDIQTETVAQDDLIDIVDFSILSSRWNQSIAATLAVGADVNGDGVQGTADFQAMQINFFEVSDPVDECGGRGDGTSEPVGFDPLDGDSLHPISGKKVLKSSISVTELRSISPAAVTADFNRDGVVDAKDIRRFAAQNGLSILPEFDRKLKQLEKADVMKSLPAPGRKRGI